MPINVDTVYQTVQALANKEQRGYITPQEFNLLANQAQSDIFEQYFYDLNAFIKKGDQARELGDSVNFVMRKINNTSGVSIGRQACTYNPASSSWTLPANPIKGRLFATNPSGVSKELTLMGMDHIEDFRNSRWHKKGFDEYAYFEDGFNTIQVWSGTGPITTGVEVERISGVPGVVNWGYLIVNEKAIYNPSTSNNFSLDSSERADIVINILKLAGISTEDAALYQAAGGEETTNLQQENK
jgi:hypothetical protein|tara:strand:- start:12174 stop:12899 length:726 start_codon:yes stop_codon:yes gene_type:complete